MSQTEKLEKAYERMVQHVHDWMQQARHEGKLVGHWFRQAADDAIEAELKLETLSRDEAQKVAAYIARDLHDASEYVKDSRNEMRFWFDFDTALLESRFHAAFVNAADPTLMGQYLLAMELEAQSHYQSGELAGAGTLICSGCGEKLQFYKPEHIPVCPQCGGTVFERIAS